MKVYSGVIATPDGNVMGQFYLASDAERDKEGAVRKAYLHAVNTWVGYNAGFGGPSGKDIQDGCDRYIASMKAGKP